MRAGLISLLLVASAATAQEADTAPEDGTWEVCNQTSFVLRVATAYRMGEALQAKGWQQAYPGRCLTYAVDNEEERFVIAESNSAHQGGIREWKGEVEMCAADTDFTANAEQSCALQNLETRPYLRVSGDEARTLLVEPEDYGSKAEVAGLQRLLRNAGYKVRRIDGLSGRGTSRTKRQFLKDRELASNLSDSDLMAELLKAAQERSSEIGLTLCNTSKQRMWGAIAFRRDGIWRSRGWWPVEADACEQVSTEPLEGLSPHFYALQEDSTPPEVDPDDPETDQEPPANPDRHLRTDAATPSQFCITEARFSAIGRDQCRDRGYVPTSFRALPDDQDGIKVSLGDADFVAPTRSGLRR